MRIAIVAAKFAPAEADRLRRAMATFKRVGTIDTFRQKFINGMTTRGYQRDFAERCFSQIEGFGEYGFPESHAASFANLVYASAWIKCFYPDVFAAALLNSQPMGFYAPAQIVRDAQEHGVEVRPVDVNFSGWDATLEVLTLPLLGKVARGPGIDVTEHGATPIPSAHIEAIMPRASGASSTLCTSDALRGSPACAGDDDLTDSPAASPARARLNPRHADMQDDIRSTHAVRLGLREIGGLVEEHGRRIESVRGAGFDSVRDLWLRSRLPPSTLEKLARADAFRSLGLDRRDALWVVRALQRSGDKDDLPLFARVHMPQLEPDAALPPMHPGEHVIEDYRHLHLSLKAHPLTFLRGDLQARGILRHEQLPMIAAGTCVSVAGLVLVRQRPGNAKAIFMTLEDETGIANIVVWLRTFEIFRPAVLGARLISVTGKLQNEQGVIHIVADRLEDLSPLLRRLTEHVRPIATPAHADLLKRDSPERFQTLRSGDALVNMLKRKPALSVDLNAEVMPKGRNFH